MKKKSSTEVWVTIGLAVFFLIFLSLSSIALFGSFREMGDTFQLSALIPCAKPGELQNCIW